MSNVLEIPSQLSQVRIFFRNAPKSSVNAAKAILADRRVIDHTFRRTTVLAFNPPPDEVTPQSVLEEIRTKFGHFRGYDGCDMAIENPDAEKQAS